MIIPGEKKAARAVLRLSVPLLLILVVLIASILIIYSIPVLTEEKRTSGNLTFTDRAGIPVSGTIEISMTGAPSGGRSDVNTVMWRNAPNARIYFAAHETKNISISLRISEDSPNGRVSLEEWGAAIPEYVGQAAPGIPVKYVGLHSTGVTFADANISIYYTDAELNGLDEKSLVIYIYEGASWIELSTRVDSANNVASATVDTLSVFAISARENQEGLKKFSDLIIPAKVKETLETDALKTKGVSVKLTINKRGDGQIKLEDHGKKNPVAVPPPGNAIKFVDIRAENISFESAEVRIHYTDEELGRGDESRLIIYHWNGAAWDALATSVDFDNNLLTATTASLSPFAVSRGEGGASQVIIAINRFVILDDPNNGKADTRSGFRNIPSGNAWNTNNWNGKNTIINATSLVIDKDGRPVTGTNVTFFLSDPNMTTNNTKYAITDSEGLANVSFDLNSYNFYGDWTVRAANETMGANATFIYNWWGCAVSSVCNGHGSENLAGGAYINSPYLSGRDRATNSNSAHRSASLKCTVCHQSFDGLPGGDVAANYSMNTTDVHRWVIGGCANASCHGGYSVHNTNELIASCYNTSGGCHKARPEISNRYTLNSSNIQIALSLYSINSTSFNATFHTPNSTVPCIICHGPMHNITKPDETERWRNNTVTEDSHCTQCHTSYQRHNQSNTSSGGVNCTLCHSEDAHYIQVFAQNSTGGAVYVNATNTSRGNCTLCHQNGVGFFNSLEANPDAGRYPGRDPPQIDVPVRHSNDANAGSKWNSTSPYWTYSSQLTWCGYCHGETNHKSAALGRPSMWDGNNVVNSTIGNTTWCVGCHWRLYDNGTSSYQDMVSNLTDDSRNISFSAGYNLSIPPEFTGNSTYGAVSSNPAYFNHTDISIKSDNSCYGCHRNGTSAVSITGFMHNLTDVSTRVSGPDCIGCHDYNKTDQDALHRINNSDMKEGVHANLNKNTTNSTGINPDNRKCWGCHTSNGSEPRPYYLNYYNMGDRYANPYQCYDCHNSTGKAYTNVSSAPQVDQHFKGAANVTAASGASDNSSSCVVCHDLNELKVSYMENDIYNSALSNASHYTTNRTDLRTWDSGRAANCSYCHQNTSTAFSAAMLDAAYNSSIKNHSTASLPTCYDATCHKSGWIHNSTLDRPSLNATNASSYCQECHTDKWKHNNTQDCGSCHFNFSSNDTIHPVKYLLQNASYGTGNYTAVTCITCHQTTAVDARLSDVPPKIPSPMHHSDNTSNGTLWNSTAYWTPGSPLTSCTYCHSDTKHNTSALGRPAGWQGNNIVNSSLSSGSWCSSCHYRVYSSSSKNYSDMILAFRSANLSVPPEITNGTYSIKIFNRSDYYNHSLKGYTDEICILCHGINLSSTSTISGLMHNITVVNTCTGCHYSFEAMNNTTRPDRYVDSVMYNASLHRSLSCTSCHTQGHRNIGARKACEDCHAVQANPVTDKDRHNITPSPSTYFVGASSVVTITECTTCHSASLYNSATSTYGYWKPKDCDYCHTYPDKYYE